MTDNSNYAHQDAIFKVSAKRFSRSPWLASYITDDTVLGVYSGRFYALTMGADPVESYWQLRRGVVLFDVPEHPIEITGPDALPFLNWLFCREVSKLRVGRATYAIACNHDGGILMDGVLLRLDEHRYWYVLAHGEFLTWLEATRVGYDVAISDPQSWVLQIQGPRSLEVLPNLLDHARPEPFNYFSVHECRIAGEPFLISRTGWTGELGFEIYSLNPQVDGDKVFRHVMGAGAKAGMIHAALDSMGIRRIEAGIMDNTGDMDSSMTPFSAGLGRFVDLNKKDFIGCEALRQRNSGNAFFGVTSPPESPVGRHAVFHGDREVGNVTIAARSPYLNQVIGYVRFLEPGDWDGTEVRLRSEDGSFYPGTITTLPFYDREKRIPRGLSDSIPESKNST